MYQIKETILLCTAETNFLIYHMHKINLLRFPVKSNSFVH